ncbi:hypothetical protein C8F04DRAFT_1196079 [Mycena alexandri]|uniref:Uncharacterized protein n=1 Tax=Mycena alexandri TaxID=1745969 RepID=A0AAD6S834_9AGAR|nr:hypothetical protein C8F04DRAFT_1196079 [Mycena alexandri]
MPVPPPWLRLPQHPRPPHSLATTDVSSMWTEWDASFDRISANVTLPLRTLKDSVRRERERVAAEERDFEMACHESRFSQPIHFLPYYPVFHTTTELQRNIPEYSWIHTATGPEYSLKRRYTLAWQQRSVFSPLGNDSQYTIVYPLIGNPTCGLSGRVLYRLRVFSGSTSSGHTPDVAPYCGYPTISPPRRSPRVLSGLFVQRSRPGYFHIDIPSGRPRAVADMVIGFRSSPELSVEEELARIEERAVVQEEVARIEEQDMTCTLRLSASGGLFRSSPPPPPTANSLHLCLRSLSPSPDLPEPVAASLAASYVFVPSPVPPLAPSATGEQHCRHPQQPATSVANKRRPQTQPSITTQLNETWMSVNGASPAPAPLSTPSSTSTIFHVRNGGSRRPFADPRQTEHFTLIFLTGAEPRILSLDTSGINSPRWPMYILSADDKTVAELSSELQDADGLPITQLDLFLHRQRTWICIDRDYPHTVSTGDVVILRWRGVHGPQDQATIDTFLSRAASQHFRYYMPRERSVVCDVLKSTTVVESDSDVKVLEGGHKIRGKRGRALSSDEDLDILSPHQVHRPRLSINTSGLVVPSAASASSSGISSPPPSALSLRSASTTSSISELPTPSLEALTQLPAKERSWPYGLYTVDVVVGFLRIDEFKGKGSLKARFQQAFGVAFKSSTYHENQKRWRSASEDLRHEMLQAKRTTAGLWIGNECELPSNPLPRVVPICCQLRQCLHVPQANHFIEKEIIFSWEHLAADGVIATKPDVHLFCDGGVKIPMTVGGHELREFCGVAMLLEEGVRDGLLRTWKTSTVIPMSVNHAHVSGCARTGLSSITVRVVDEMLGLVCAGHGKCLLDEKLDMEECER